MQTVIKNPNWWRRRTTLERCLTLLSTICVIAIIGLIIGLGTVLLTKQPATELESPKPAQALHAYDTNASKNKVPTSSDKPISSYISTQNICFSPQCIHTASNVLKKLKPEIEPCDDFYHFACGTFLDEVHIAEDKISENIFTRIADKLQEQLKELIMEERKPDEPKHFLLPNTLYKACMNKSLIESLDVEPIKKFADMLGGWPVIVGDAWDTDNKWTWQNTVKMFRKYGFSVDYLIDFSVSINLKNNTKRIIDLDQGLLSVSREFLIKGLNDTIVSAYYNYMVDIAVLFGANKTTAQQELKESLDFEIELAKISLPPEERRDSNVLYNLYTIKQLQQLYGYVDWLDYINSILPEKVQVDENEIVNVDVPSYLEEFGKLVNRTDKRTICNYMMWRIHAFSIAFLSERFRKRQLDYSTAVTGLLESEDRWKECVDITTGSLGIAIGSMYVRRYFREDSKAIALDMVNNIKEVFHKVLERVDWMDEITRQRAIKKLEGMKTHIGYPDELMDDKILGDYYKNHVINPDKYFESLLRLNIVATNYSFSKLPLPVNKSEWIRYARPAIVNAYYGSLENSIQFPAGILQGHFFNAQRPKYMNYGAIGYVIGHEITHGFDDQGRQFDLDGNLVDWWMPQTQELFLEKAKCIIEQYGNFTDELTGLSLNGINTQGENIADNGGLKQSYIAYKNWLNENGGEPKLPGLDYTEAQMFWISAAQTWCSKYRKESLKLRIKTGVHSPGEFRVFGTMQNLKEFSRDFHCPEGSRMNPTHKCQVW